MKDIILREVRLNPCEVRLKRTSENSETWKNSNFLFGWRGPLVIICRGWGQEEGGRGQRFQMGGSEGPD